MIHSIAVEALDPASQLLQQKHTEVYVRLCVCVCACVCERRKEKKRIKKDMSSILFPSLSHPLLCLHPLLGVGGGDTQEKKRMRKLRFGKG